MSLTGARGLLNVSLNRDCQLLAGMVVDGIDDTQLYNDIAGAADDETGERQSALKRGARFESALYADDARNLREVLCRSTKRDPDSISVLDFRTVRAKRGESKQQAQIRIMRTTMRALAEGKMVPDLLVQAPLSITLTNEDVRVVYADFALMDPMAQMYVPGEIKSFISRDNCGPSMSLVRVRRQIAVYIVALIEEARRVSLEDRILASALLVFASPYGMRPTRAYKETLDAEVTEMELALSVLRQYKNERLANDVEGNSSSNRNNVRTLYDEGRFNYTDQCQTICALSPLCKRRVNLSTRILGDDISAILGQDVDLSRLSDLVQGAEAATEFEIAFARSASELSMIIGGLGLNADPIRSRYDS